MKLLFNSLIRSLFFFLIKTESDNLLLGHKHLFFATFLLKYISIITVQLH